MEFDELLRIYTSAYDRVRQQEQQTVRMYRMVLADVPLRRDATEPLVRPDVASYLEAWYAR